MGTNNNTSRMVAQALPQLRERCGFCIALSRGVDANIDEGFVGFGDCVVCMGQGWQTSPPFSLRLFIRSHWQCQRTC